jgi:glutaredoxin-like YruB-family protein
MKNVIIYSTPTCHYCGLAKDYFKAHGVNYTEHNVASDLEQRKVMVDKSGQLGVPVIDIEGDITVGFDEAHLAEVLGVK